MAGIVGMGKAAALAKAHLDAGGNGRIADKRDRFERDVRDLATSLDVETRVNGGGADRLPNTTNIGFARLASEALLVALSEQGICASAGAACSSGVAGAVARDAGDGGAGRSSRSAACGSA